MSSIILVVGAFVGYLLAYRLYGRFLARKIFKLRDTTEVPSHRYADGVDYVPTRREILFGHHFTTIAGVGPIVGPAIGVIWGWLPALLWILLGSVFVGGVHDFGALVVSARNRGRTIGEVSASLLSRRISMVFMLVIAVLLWVVLALFAFVIAKLFVMYPASVLPIWFEIPLALWLGWAIYKRHWSVKFCSIVALVVMYATVYLGTLMPLSFERVSGVLIETGDAEAQARARALVDAGKTQEARALKGVTVIDGSFFPKAVSPAPPPSVRADLIRERWRLTRTIVTVSKRGEETLSRKETPCEAPLEGRPVMIAFSEDGAISSVVIETDTGEVEVEATRERSQKGETVVEKRLVVSLEGAGGFLSGAWGPQVWTVRDGKRICQRLLVRDARFCGRLPAEVIWILVLLAYIYIASTLPVHWLLQPRDYINSHELYVAMGLVAVGIFIAARPVVAPAVNMNIIGAPAFFPFLFVVIACGAVSGFHALAASGTTVRQMNNEKDALSIGYGSMLLEGALAVLVIAACCAGFKNFEAWQAHYSSWHAAGGLGAKLGAFVQGASTFVSSLGVPAGLAAAVLAVLIVSFAATTLDSACRIQRYIFTELASGLRIPLVGNRFVATALVVASAAALAFVEGAGTGGLILWPVFGTVNQLLAGLVLLVVAIYLLRRGVRTPVVILPMIFLLVMTTWALIVKLIHFWGANWLLFGVSVVIAALEAWIVVEAVVVFLKPPPTEVRS